MNTNNVYFGKIYEVNGVTDNYFNKAVDLMYKKDALMIVKTDCFGNKYMKDLNNGQKYQLKLPTKKGMLYVSRRSVKTFNYVTDNDKINLPKVKIKQIGNEYLNKKEK